MQPIDDELKMMKCIDVFDVFSSGLKSNQHRFHHVVNWRNTCRPDQPIRAQFAVNIETLLLSVFPVFAAASLSAFIYLMN